MEQLLVSKGFLLNEENQRLLKNSRFLILEHILEDTEILIELIEKAGASIFAVLAKPFTVNVDVLNRMEKKYRIIKESYSIIENSNVIPNLLKETIQKSLADNKHIIIIDIGGYFAKFVTNLNEDEMRLLSGIIEVTSFGHYRYEKLISKVKIPVISVARSPLKEIESKFVGETAATVAEVELMKIGLTIAGKNALVIGYGLIGKSLAKSLKLKGAHVSIYDKNEHKVLSAYFEGYKISEKINLIKEADLIFSVTGDKAISFEEISLCKDNVFLASVGSKDTEFEFDKLQSSVVNQIEISKYLSKYQLKNLKSIFVFRNGTAVNFIMSGVQTEVIDIIFSEILNCAFLLLKNNPNKLTIGKIHSTPEQIINQISKQWLNTKY